MKWAKSENAKCTTLSCVIVCVCLGFFFFVLSERETVPTTPDEVRQGKQEPS